MSKFYLRDISSRDEVWDKRRCDADQVESIYESSEYVKYSDRISRCAKMLFFGSCLDVQERKVIKLKSASFCRVRNCPVCQWRGSLMWKLRLANALPLIEQDYPKARWVLLTLTVRNCPITSLRDTLTLMNSAWKRLSQLKKFPAIGTFKSLEVTRGKDGSAHPHFHVLMLVNPGYFKGTQYLSHESWVKMWRKALRADYDPNIDVRAVKTDKDDVTRIDIITEIAKYTVKPSDLIADHSWLLEYTNQVHKMRSISVSGILKEYLSDMEATNQELVIGESGDPIEELIQPYYIANWDKPDSKYTIRDMDAQ
jgi:plasmid rolling circle replication initiator protein Rep